MICRTKKKKFYEDISQGFKMIKFTAKGLEQFSGEKLQNYFRPFISQSVEAGLFHVVDNAVDFEDREPYYYDFKNVRADRTGKLADDFRVMLGQEAVNLAFRGNKVTAQAFSRVYYADEVASNNNFYKTILKASERGIDKHFEEGVKLAMKNLGFK